MANSTVPCPHCKEPVTVRVGQIEACPSCGGEVRVHAVAKDTDDEALKRLLASVKIVERIDPMPGAKPPAEPEAKRPWWKFWG